MAESNCCLGFLVIVGVTGGLVLQSVALLVAYLDTLCEVVPDDRSYCNASFDVETNRTVLTKEMTVYTAYVAISGTALFLHVISWLMAASVVLCCAKTIVRCCPSVLKSCAGSGHKWYVGFVKAGIVNLAAIIMTHAVIPLSDIYNYVTAVKYSIGCFGLEVVVVSLWCLYTHSSGQPDPDYFLGSTKMFSDYEIESTKTRHYVKDEYGNVSKSTSWEHELKRR